MRHLECGGREENGWSRCRRRGRDDDDDEAVIPPLVVVDDASKPLRHSASATAARDSSRDPAARRILFASRDARAEMRERENSGSKKATSGKGKKRVRYFFAPHFRCRSSPTASREREQNASPTGGPAPARCPAAPLVDTALHGPGVISGKCDPGGHACRLQIRRAGGGARDVGGDGRAAFAVALDPLLRHRRGPGRRRAQHGRHRRALLLRVHAADRDLHGARAGVHEDSLHGAAAGEFKERRKRRRKRAGRRNKSQSREFFHLLQRSSPTLLTLSPPPPSLSPTTKKNRKKTLSPSHRSGASSSASPSRLSPTSGRCSPPGRGSGRTSTRTCSSPASFPSCSSRGRSPSSGTWCAASCPPRCCWRAPGCSWARESPRSS